MKKKIIITGGAGFIGSHMHNQLTSKGHKVFIIDSNRSYLNFNHDLYSNYYKDILYRQKNLLKKAKMITPLCSNYKIVITIWLNKLL